MEEQNQKVEQKDESKETTPAADAGIDKPAEKEATVDKGKQENAEKTFTQAELDRIVGERLQRERGKMPGKEQLEAFQKWQEGQKTAEQQHAEELAKVQREAEAAKAELEKLRQLDLVRQSQVDSQFADFVHFKAASLAQTKNIGFEEALVIFLKESGEPYKKRDTRNVTVDTGVKQEQENREKETKNGRSMFF